MVSPQTFSVLSEQRQIMVRMGVSECDPYYIIRLTCDILNEDVTQISSSSRKQGLVHCRHIATGLILTLNPKMTPGNVGRLLNRDRTTILNSQKVFNNWYGLDKEFTDKVNLIKEKL